jgi:hypothetical protein
MRELPVTEIPLSVTGQLQGVITGGAVREIVVPKTVIIKNAERTRETSPDLFQAIDWLVANPEITHDEAVGRVKLTGMYKGATGGKISDVWMREARLYVKENLL